VIEAWVQKIYSTYLRYFGLGPQRKELPNQIDLC